MKKLYFIFAIIIFPLFAKAQQGISVLTFEQLPMDLSARTYPQIDMSNGKLAALIKIETTQTGFDFDVGQLGIVKVEYKTAEIWVYVPEKAKSIRIAHPVLGQLPDRFYFFPVPIVSASVYRMVLVTGIVETIVRQPQIQYQYLIINTNPTGADVFINDIAAGQTPFSQEMELGKYTYRISKALYKPEAGYVELKIPDGKQKIDFTLKPDFGIITIVTKPEAGADLSLNQIPLNAKTPYTLNIPTGEQTVEVRKNMFKPTTKKITVVAGETRNFEIEMEPTFNTVTINTEPKADIYINGTLKGSGKVTERLNIGIHTVEAKQTNYNTVTERITVSLGEPLLHTLKLIPKLGTLKIHSTPIEATVKLNGENKGTTPLTIRNHIVGDYDLEISLQGYATVKKKITIEENKEITETITLNNSFKINITSDPSGATVKINGEQKGKTPLNVDVELGMHDIVLEKEGYTTLSEKLNVVESKKDYSFKLEIFRKPFEIEMVFVQGGTFTMGCTSEQGSDCFDSEKPSHQVTLSSYKIGKYPVTQAQWKAVMDNNPSFFKGDSLPVENVNWNETQEFIKKLNKMTGKQYRLPTEAEWEYAARGGNKSQGFKYSGSNNINDVGWYWDNSYNKTQIVGKKQPNELDIYDMSGNVWEWCNDWYGPYISGSMTNPTGFISGSDRVYRGGSWSSDAKGARVSDRFNRTPNYSNYNLGFRLAHSTD